MRKYIPYSAVLLVFILLLVFFTLKINLKKTSFIGNKDIIYEIIKIEKLSIQDEEGKTNISAKDVQRLKEFLKDDGVAESYANEIEWLIRNGESRHIIHSTLFLREYIKTGKDIPCIPHELWHISLFARHKDMDYARNQLKFIDKEYNVWIESVDKKRDAYPQFYKSLDELKLKIKDSIAKLKQNDYSENTLNQLDSIGADELC